VKKRRAVALIIGDPSAEELLLNEACLTAAAKMIEVHGAAADGRWEAGRRSTVFCFDIARPRRESQGRTARHLGRQA